MKRHRYHNEEERRILTGLIVSDEVLGGVFSKVGTGKELFASRWSNLIARWCLEYFAKYSRAPRASIRDLFRKFASSAQDEDTVEIVEKFLTSLDQDFKLKGLNERYLLDQTSEYFCKVRLSRMVEATGRALERDEVAEALELQSQFEKIDFSTTAEVNPTDPSEIEETFTYYSKDRSLLRFPGDLGFFLSDAFERDGFIAFTGPDKRGKSFWLCEVVWRALRSRCRVLYYGLGDMSKTQIERRLYQRMLLRPAKQDQEDVRWPVELDPRGRKDPGLRTKTIKRRALTKEAVKKRIHEFKSKMQIDSIPLALEVRGGGLICAGDIERRMQQMAEKDVLPDVVVVDYADELAAEPNTRSMDKRHQINENWRILRRVALNFHCLVVTATQSASTAYSDKWVIRKGDFSEDKRKNAHVTGMIGINQKDEEKEKGIMRLNWVVIRDGHWSDTQVVWCAGNLSVASPCILSSLG